MLLPMVMELMSARKTQRGNMDDPGPIEMSPSNTADLATKLQFGAKNDGVFDKNGDV